ncbi:MAG: DUF502 domain-containing protein [Firmicutes bacterium]|nr:DUF502 domain-containing protein [Bacillota bacterium]
MKRLAKYFVNGLITMVPILLTTYIVLKVFNFLDGLLGRYLIEYLGIKIPGLGLLITLVIITAVGFLATAWISRKVLSLIDHLVNKIPLIKGVYGTIKDTVNSLLGDKKSFSQVALVDLPGTRAKIVGFVSTEDLSAFGPIDADHIAVYVPQSFQVAGFTLLVPRADVTILEMSPDEAWRFILSAGVAG